MRFMFVNILDGLIAKGIVPSLKKAGHEVFEFGGYEQLTFTTASYKIQQDIKKIKPDYLFFVGTGVGIVAFDVMIQVCDEENVGLIFWAIEDPVEFTTTLKFAKASCLTLSPSIECVNMYRKLGINSQLFLFACNPEHHKQGEYRPDLDYDMCLYARCYTDHPVRNRGYDIIIDASLDLIQQETARFRVYGNYWGSQFGINKLKGKVDLIGNDLPIDFIPSLCRSTKIILGVQCVDSSDTQTSSRTYEVLGCGGFHLTQWTNGIENLFKEGVHLVTAKTKDEAKEKMRYYWNHPEQRLKIARQGQEYVYKEHTFDKRVEDILLTNVGK